MKTQTLWGRELSARVEPRGYILRKGDYPHGPGTCSWCGSSRAIRWLFWRGACLHPHCPTRNPYSGR